MQKVLGNSERFVMTWTTFKSTEIMKYSLSIHEAHGEIPDYNKSRIHLSWAQNRLSKTKSLQLNNHEAFLYLWKIFLEHEHHDIPEFCSAFKSWHRRHLWVGFVVGSLPSSERLYYAYFGFPVSSRPNSNSIRNACTCLNKFLRTPQCGLVDKQITKKNFFCNL